MIRIGQFTTLGWNDGEILTVVGNNVVQASSTGAVRLPTGTSADRPNSPADGEVRFATDFSRIEVAMGGVFTSIVPRSMAVYRRSLSPATYSSYLSPTFNTADVTTPDVTTTDNTTFTIQRSGLWLLILHHMVMAASYTTAYAAGDALIRVNGTALWRCIASAWKHTSTGATNTFAFAPAIVFGISALTTGNQIDAYVGPIPDSGALQLDTNRHSLIFVYLG